MRFKLINLLAVIFIATLFIQCDSISGSESTGKSNDPPPLPDTKLISPTDNAKNQSTQIELSWDKIKGAKDYQVQLAQSQDFDATLVDSTVSGTSVTTSQLKSGTTYYWRVKPVKKEYGGPPLKWTDTWQFTTATSSVETVTVELQSPAEGAELETTSPVFEWSSASETVNYYHYQLSRNQDFSDIVTDSVTQSTTLQVYKLSSSQQYYWRVTPVLNLATGEWSKTYDFTITGTSNDTTTTDSTLAAPVQISPADGDNDVSLNPTFKWGAINGADHYILHANRIDPAEMVIETTVDDTTYTPQIDLDPASTHDWRVRAVKDGVKGDWSDIDRFTTTSQISGTSPVTLVSPSDGASDQPTSLTLDWDALSGVSNYQVQLAGSNTFSSPIVDEIVGGTTYDVSGLDNGQTYYWRVQAYGDGDTGNWSSIRSFTTKSANTGGTSGGRSGDEAALEALYQSTNGSNWKNHTGWNRSGMSLSDNIYGVEVETINGELRVVSVKLNGTTGWKRPYLEGVDGKQGGNNLTGTLPPEIGNLTECKYFNVKNNHITGTIPSEIGDMASLQALFLNGRFFDFAPQDAHHPGKAHDTNERSNSFTGSFPSTIGNLSNLVYLEAEGEPNWTKDNVGNQGFTGAIPSTLNNLTKLEGLNLSFNSFTSIPDLSGLTNMIDIAFDRNNITQPFPEWVASMTSLRYLWMRYLGGTGDDGTGLTGQIPDLSGLTKLEVFAVAANSLSGNFPNYMIDGTMPNINMISLGWNDNITGTLGPFGQTNLTMLGLNGCSMYGELPSSLSGQHRMTNLNIGYGNNFTGQFPNLSQMFRLRHVYANGNSFTGTLPMVDTSNDALQFLHFQNNQMSGEIPAELAEIGNLPRIGKGDLRITNNKFSDADEKPLKDALEADGNLNILYD